MEPPQAWGSETSRMAGNRAPGEAGADRHWLAGRTSWVLGKQEPWVLVPALSRTHFGSIYYTHLGTFIEYLLHVRLCATPNIPLYRLSSMYGETEAQRS